MPAVISFTSPANGVALSGTVPVQVSATDNVGVTSAKLSVDRAVRGTDTAAHYNFSWNTTTVANGTHTLTASAVDAAGAHMLQCKAYDAAGNVGASSVVTVYK